VEIPIVFEDDSILVLEKPPGLVVDNSETQAVGTVEEWLGKRVQGTGYRVQLERNGIVHRLDKDTSGLLLIAKTPEALENLQNQFKNRTTKKEYLVLVHGNVSEPGRVEGSIGRNPGDREKFTVLENGGKEAVTEYEPVKNYELGIKNLESWFPDFNKIQMRKLERMSYGKFTLLRCYPKTGRTHQIRVHLKHIGFPIVSDEKYVGRKMYRLDKRFCPRQFLHAAKLGFNHPASGEWIEFENKLPEDLEKALVLLESSGQNPESRMSLDS
jgi:23S rRNA pseudouridine1911/1915/1917 synthase